MRILHLLYAGDTGGIEKLCRDIGMYSGKDENFFLFVHAGGAICREMQEKGLHTEILGLDNKNILKLYQVICARCKTQHMDWIVIHHPAPLCWLAAVLYLCRKSRAKVAVYVHGSYDRIVKGSRCRKAVYNLLMKKCDGIIAISEFVKNTIVKNTTVPGCKIRVIYNGILVQEYKNTRWESCVLPIRLVYVGRLIEQKGVQILLHALALMKNKDAWRLQVVGDGEYRNKLEKMVQELGLEEQVSFAGVQSRVSEYLKNSDVFVHTPILEEGFGIAVAEAMSAGLICVTFRRGAIPEIIEDGVNGYIVAGYTAQALAEKLEEVKDALLDNNLSDMRVAAEQSAAAFSIEGLTEQLHQFYLFSI